jgi:hypothetical protein
MAISSDGRFVVYSALEENPGPQVKSRLFLRRMDQSEAKPIAGTEGGINPFLSPDNRWVGYWADLKLMKIPVEGGLPTPLCDAPSIYGANWGRDNSIHPERTVLYRVLFHHFERFVAEYESRFEREYGFFRPIVKEVVERYLDCGNPFCGFARIRCPHCRAEHLLMFSCKTRGFCPSCHAKRKVGYRWGQERAVLETMDYLEFIARVTSHIPDKGQVTVRYYGLYANAHRGGKVRKASLSPLVLRMAEEEVRRIPSKGWAEIIRKVYEVDPMLCPKCGGAMKIVAFISDYRAVDRIIDHLKLRFVAEKPPPSHVFEQVALMAAEERTDYF